MHPARETENKMGCELSARTTEECARKIMPLRTQSEDRQQYLVLFWADIFSLSIFELGCAPCLLRINASDSILIKVIELYGMKLLPLHK